MFKKGDPKITEKNINLYKKLEKIEGEKAKRELIHRLSYGAALMVALVIVASIFMPAEQVKVITEMIDTIFKYIPIVG